MNTVLLICAILVTLSLVVGVVYLVLMLIEIRKVASQAEALLRNINDEISAIRRITDNITSFSEKFSSPLFKAGTWMAGIISVLMKKNKQTKADKPAEE